jgi:hypothetical protein
MGVGLLPDRAFGQSAEGNSGADGAVCEGS